MRAPAAAPLPQDVAEAVRYLLEHGLPAEALLDLRLSISARLDAGRPGEVALGVCCGPRRIGGAHVEERRVYRSTTLGS